MPAAPLDPLFALAQSADDQIDLARGALLIARDAHPGIALEPYLEHLDRMAAEVHPRLEEACTPQAHLDVVNQYLFCEQGFRGNIWDYEDPRNSYLDEVLDRRLGTPITLSVVYLEVGRRLGLPLAGVSLPLRFVVRYQARPEPLFLDAFAGGRVLDRISLARLAGCRPARLQRLTESVSSRHILARLLRTLEQHHLRRRQFDLAMRAAERITWLLPQAPQAYRDLGFLYYKAQAYHRSIEAFDSYLRWADAPADAQDIVTTQAMVATELALRN